MMKQEQEKHCHLKWGKIGRHQSLVILKSPCAHIPISHTVELAALMVVAHHSTVLHGSALWDTLPFPSPSLAASEEDIG